ncbi:MAG: hypothetical protein IKV97_06510, partial [Clostridia bacterium]|nr:hypothetical protein [Clostridia bacterium]
MKKYLAAAFIFPLIAGSGALYMPGTEIVIAENGKSDYVIVRPENCDFKVKSAALKLSREIKKATGADIPVVTDSEPISGGPHKPCEILIGDTSRKSSSLSPKDLLYSDYSVNVYDKTVSVSAVNYDVYSQAVDYIIKNFVSDGVFSVKKELRYTHRADYEIDSMILCGKDISEYTLVAESSVFSEYADGLVQNLLKKTGKGLSVDEKTSADRSEIIFTYGEDLSPMQYSIKSSDGDIFVCAPSALAKSEVCGKFDEILFSGGNTVNKESFDITGEVTPTNEYERFITMRGALSNTLSKLTDKKELTVAYFGGSVTVGHGATDREKYSWRALTTKWLKENFPKANVTEVNAAIGATGSHLGAFRTE